MKLSRQHTTCGRLIDVAPSNPSAVTMPSKPEIILLETKNPLLHTHDRTLSEAEVDVVSGGHAMHWVMEDALYCGEKVLAGQSVHVDDFSAANVPALHPLHVMSFEDPSMGDAVPTGQLMHTPPVGEENVPLEQMSTTSSSCVMD